MAKTKIHPVAAKFPALSAEARTNLFESIKEHGCQVPVVFWQNQVIDGKNRVEICEELGFNFPRRDLDKTEVQACKLAFSLNAHRRHSTPEALAFAGAEVAEMLKELSHQRRVAPLGPIDPNEKNTGKTHLCTRCARIGKPSCEACRKASEKGKTAAQAAEIVGSTETNVKRAMAIEKNGTPALVEAVKAGDVSLSDAAKVAKQPPAVQNRAVQAVKEGKAPTASAAVKPRAGKPIFDDAPIEKVIGQLTRLFDSRANALGKCREHQACIDAMNDVLGAWKKWQKK